ncbi:MAG: 4Fe-4S dicluster domain-containing protein [Rikenellaceae bacterium]
MAKIIGDLQIERERCKGCGVCVTACPIKVLTLSKEVNGKGYPFAMMVEGIQCIGCASCAIICPDSCITVYRQKVE